jgi:hypothetical protein
MFTLEDITDRTGEVGTTTGEDTVVMALSIFATTAMGITVVGITAMGVIERDKQK